MARSLWWPGTRIWWFGWEITPIGSPIWILGLQLVVLFGRAWSMSLGVSFENLYPHPISRSLFALCLLLKMCSLNFLFLFPCLPSSPFLPWWTRSPLKLSAKINTFFHKLLLVIAFYHSNTKQTMHLPFSYSSHLFNQQILTIFFSFLKPFIVSRAYRPLV